MIDKDGTMPVVKPIKRYEMLALNVYRIFVRGMLCTMSKMIEATL